MLLVRFAQGIFHVNELANEDENLLLCESGNEIFFTDADLPSACAIIDSAAAHAGPVIRVVVSVLKWL